MVELAASAKIFIIPYQKLMTTKEHLNVAAYGTGKKQ